MMSVAKRLARLSRTVGAWRCIRSASRGRRAGVAMVAGLLLAATAVAADDALLPVVVKPDDPHLRFSGRWDLRDANGPRCAWSACAVRWRMRGDAVQVALAGEPGIGIQVVVDGEPTATLQIEAERQWYAVATGLKPGEHVLELWKRTEAFTGVAQLKGLRLSSKATLLDLPAPNRRLEFIGDSITAGYGDEAASKDEHFTPATENAWLTWGVVAARALHADVAVEAWSGIWLMDNGKDEPMPRRWDKTLPFDPGSAWDFARWQPDAVVIDLGTNDSSRPIDEKAWDDAYTAFITRIRAVYPRAHVFLVIGPMGHGPEGCIARYNDALVAALAKQGETRVHALALPDQKQEDGIGADWHPSAKTHRRMADLITAAVQRELRW